MSETPLFPELPEALSPRLAWLRAYQLTTWSYTKDGETYWACGPEALFSATARKTVFDEASELDATIAWAELHHIRHWTLE